MKKPKTLQEFNYDLTPQIYFRQKRLELAPAFKRFHEETGGGLGDFLETHEGEMLADKIDYPPVRENAISVDLPLQEAIANFLIAGFCPEIPPGGSVCSNE